GHILVDDTVAKPFLGHLGRCHRASGEHDVDALVEYPFDKRDHRDGLPDACSVHPDERTRWSFIPGNTVAFTGALAVFLALGSAPGNIGPRERIGGSTCDSIGRKHGARPPLAHFPASTRR